MIFYLICYLTTHKSNLYINLVLVIKKKVKFASFVKALDGDMYERILEYFHTMGNALLDVSSMEKSASESIAKQADMVSYSNN